MWNCAKGVPASKVFGTCCLNHSRVFRICVFFKFFWLFLSLTFKPKIFDASWKCCLCEKYCFYLHTPQERSSYSLCTSIQLFLRIIWQRIPKAIHFWFGGLGIYPPKLSKLLSTEASVDYDNGIKLETVYIFNSGKISCFTFVYWNLCISTIIKIFYRHGIFSQFIF